MAKKQDLHLTKCNTLTATAVKVRNVGKVSLNVQGTGCGTLAVVQTYRTMKKDESHCDLFHLSVTVKGELEYKIYNKEEMFEDYYNYDVDEDQKDEPMSSMEWFDLRSRRKRQISEVQKKESSVSLCGHEKEEYCWHGHGGNLTSKQTDTKPRI